MNTLKTMSLSALGLLAMLPAKADRVFYMPMDVKGEQVAEAVSGTKYNVETANVVECVPGAKGNALRLDGYSNFVTAEAALGEMSKFTFSLWCAMETWPIIEHDIQNESEMTCIAGNYDPAEKSGFGFFVGRTGKWAFKAYTQGWPVEIVAPEPLPLYQWNNLVASCDGSKVTLYNNGVAIGSTNCKAVAVDGAFWIGKDADGRKFDKFCLNTINGIIDEIEILDVDTDAATIQGWTPDADPDLTVVAEGRYDTDLFRPAFHGMPSRNWTNETHGLIWHNGQYHLFFQKNANGPYMSRLQWGHLVSENLYEWHEMPIALGSDKWYDLKGCWSGCVVVDDAVTDGEPNLIYTGVDYARAMIGQASPADDELLAWNKRANPIINGRPSGLSDDFRDPYFFRNGDDAYIIVGTSKDNKGACTLHKYDPATRSWSNDGKIFFSAANAYAQGTFWEMPSLTKIGDKWLFAVTPLGLGTGVQAMYWVGTLNADGTFNTTSTPAAIELPGFAKEGYGLLSPSVMQADGKTIAMGIVPDKLASSYNYQLGWAHAYSLPREWSINENGQLMQKPYSGLEAMRIDGTMISKSGQVEGYQKMADMNDRQIEVEAEFTVGEAEFGLSFYSEDGVGANLSYAPSTGRLVLDMSQLARWHNDDGVFNGVYKTSLPEPVATGEILKMHVFVDHSIMDIFINDKWASSVRLFPTESAACGMGVYSNGGSTQANIKAWSLNDPAGIQGVCNDNISESERVDVYNTLGMMVRRNVARADALTDLPQGIYIVGGKKVLVK